ncbi:MAG: hypothetical protein LC659_14920, partial [Myxococcales bacterium]|nr:hypothetical protein [Myxococcales bacterium]
PIAAPSTLNAAVPPALDALCARAMALAPDQRWRDGAAMARALEPHVHALGFGPTQLAALMRDFAPPPVADEPARHTMTVAGATATVVDPPRPKRRRRARLFAAAALGAAAGLGAFVAWPRHVEELVPPGHVAATVAAPPRPLAATIPPAPLASPATAAPPSRTPAARKTASKAAMKPAPKTATKAATKPDLVEGKLLNPFNR